MRCSATSCTQPPTNLPIPRTRRARLSTDATRSARGQRLLEDIHDDQLRETVRLALRLHKDPFAGPDARARARIRSRVLDSLRPRGATIADRVAIAFEILAKPAPYAMRALGFVLV